MASLGSTTARTWGAWLSALALLLLVLTRWLGPRGLALLCVVLGAEVCLAVLGVFQSAHEPATLIVQLEF